MTSSPRHPGAFTLIELILVLAVISMVLTLCAPAMRGFFESRQTAEAAQNVLAMTRWARSEAVTRGNPCRLNFDSAAGCYWLTEQNAGCYVPIRSDIGRRFQLPDGVDLHLLIDGNAILGAAGCIQFQPTGRSDAATIEIRGRQGEQYQVKCLSPCEPFRVVTPLEAQ